MATALQARKIDEPFVPSVRTAKIRDEVFAALEGLGLGEGLEVNKSVDSMRWYLVLYRRAKDTTAKFRLRRYGRYARIWRVA